MLCPYQYYRIFPECYYVILEHIECSKFKGYVLMYNSYKFMWSFVNIRRQKTTFYLDLMWHFQRNISKKKLEICRVCLRIIIKVLTFFFFLNFNMCEGVNQSVSCKLAFFPPCTPPPPPTSPNVTGSLGPMETCFIFRFS